jgi:microsomal dipeptidase-like Zn-dependent dipeptidase
MIADLHAHYPMHLVPGDPGQPLGVFSDLHVRQRLLDRTRGLLVGMASRFANYRSFTSGPGVTVEKMRAGGVGIALSVLYSPFDEADALRPFGAPPGPEYVGRIIRQLELVEDRIGDRHAGQARVARDPAELDAALEAGELAVLHAIEGGFHLGPDPAVSVPELAARGLAYVTLAHLFYRGVATNANALPFLPDSVYHTVFRQPRIGLTTLGEACVRAMAAHGVLIDVTHMSARSLHDTFALLDDIDPGRTVPVLASHMACRFGSYEYNLDDDTIAAVARRGGVLGVIACDHFVRTDGHLHRAPKTWEGTVRAICKQVDHVHEVTGSHEYTAIGTDLDGYIKPMLTGLEDSSKLADLEAALVDRYGLKVAEGICSGNALRMFRAGWRSTLT